MGKPKKSHGKSREDCLVCIDVRGLNAKRITKGDAKLLASRVHKSLLAYIDSLYSTATETAGMELAVGGESAVTRRKSSGAAASECPVIQIEHRTCTDPVGGQYPCRCELHECADGSQYWTCEPE